MHDHLERAIDYLLRSSLDRSRLTALAKERLTGGLGGPFPAPGTYREFGQLASIAEVEGNPKALDMVAQLVAAQEATARTARALFPIVEEANDQPTADLLTQRLDVHEKTAWMLRSLLEE